MTRPTYLTIAFLLLMTTAFAQVSDLNFKRFTKREGLSSNNITCFAQTPDGYLWIGTTDGLNRFDGYEFKVFSNDPHDATSLSDNNITTLYVDDSGILWIGTPNEGLMKFHPGAEAFEHYQPSFYHQNAISHEFVTSIAQDANQDLWVGTILGLNRYQPETNDFKRYFFETSYLIDDKSIKKLRSLDVPKTVVDKVQLIKDSIFFNENQLRSALRQLMEGLIDPFEQKIFESANAQRNAEHIRVLEPDKKGNLWIAYETGGLSCFNPNTNNLTDYSALLSTINKSEVPVGALQIEGKSLWIGFKDGTLFEFRNGTVREAKLPGNPGSIETIYLDGQQTIWVGDNSGLYRMKSNEGIFREHLIDPFNEWGVSTHAVTAIFQDNQYNTWIGIVQGGVNQILQDIPFTTYNDRSSSKFKLTKNSVSSLLEDSEGNLWIGYYTSGLDYWDKAKNKLIHFEFDPFNPMSIGKGTVFSIFEDSEGLIWVGTYEGGLQLLDRKTNMFHSFKHDPNDSLSISGNDVRCIREDSRGNVWLAIHGGGINQFNKSNGQCTRYYADYLNWENSLSDDWTFTLAFDDKDNLWVGSVAGISIFSPQSKTFRSYNTRNSQLSHDKVRALEVGPNGKMWVATESGLNLFDLASESFRIITSEDGLLDNLIVGIQADHDNNWWVATRNGVSYMNSQDWSVKSFQESDAFEPNEFFPGAYTGSSQKMYFGGSNGLLGFQPSEFPSDTMAVPLILTEFRANGVEYSLQNEIVLPHNRNSVKIRFVGVSFEHASHQQYAYLLKGLDDEWKFVDKSREVSFSNLPPGDYQFHLKSAKSPGNWDQSEQLLAFEIKPPFWQNVWAYMSYGIISVLLLLLARKLLLNKERRRNQSQLIEYQEQLNAEQDSLKVKFYEEISKDLQAPLDLIKNPLQKLIAENDAISPRARLSYFKLINRNARKLMRIIEQLSDISQFDTEASLLNISKLDIVKYCRQITDTFIYQADKKKIDFTFESTLGEAVVYFDIDKLEKILYYLLSSVFRQSISDQKITVRLRLLEINAEDVPKDLVSRSISKSVQIIVEHTSDRINSSDSSDAEELEKHYVLTIVKQLITSHMGLFNPGSDAGRSWYSIWIPVDQIVYKEASLLPVPDLIARVRDLESCVNSELLDDLFEAQSENKSDTSFILQLNEMIDAQLSNDNFGPDELADLMNLSRSQLYKKVRNECDESVSILIRNRRLTKAFEILSQSEYSISEVAYAVGFSDPGYFTKCFKEMYGRSPSEYVRE